MRIDLSNISGSADLAQPSPSSVQGRKSAANDPLGTDVAQLSSDHLKAQSLSAAVSQLPEIRQEKVAALAQSIRRGEYQVNSAQTAAALAAHMAERSAGAGSA